MKVIFQKIYKKIKYVGNQENELRLPTKFHTPDEQFCIRDLFDHSTPREEDVVPIFRVMKQNQI